MPKSDLDRARVLSRLGAPVSRDALDELLFLSKAEVEAEDDTTLTLSVTPDRLDLLSEGGLALHLEGALERAVGILPIREHANPGPLQIEVDASVTAVRPAIAGVVVHAPRSRALDDGTLAEAVRFQELLHATVGRERRVASLGIYPVERVRAPVRYALEPLSEVRFVPLDGSEEVGAEPFFRDHPLAARYGAYGRVDDRCLTLRDAAGEVLSLPPVLNSRTAGEARVGDRVLLLESTGTRARAVREALGLLLLVFVAYGWTVSPVPVRSPEGSVEDGRAVFAPRPIELTAARVASVLGRSLSSADLTARLQRARLGSRTEAAGDRWTVSAPPWRPDLLTEVDVAEDVVLAGALRAEDGLLLPSRSRGRVRKETQFRRRIASLLLGLGFAAPYTSVLVSDAAVARLDGGRSIRLANPVSAEFSHLRDRLLLSHLEVLAHNTRFGYPQRFAEVGPVIVPAPAAEPGAETRYRAGLLVASDTAGFAEAAALVDYLLRSTDVGSVREPAELPCTIPGRAARARVAGEVVAELGEIHPSILADMGVPVPVAWAELDLTVLWTLLGGDDTV